MEGIRIAKTLAASVALTAGLVLLSAPALADHRHSRSSRHHHDDEHDDHGRHYEHDHRGHPAQRHRPHPGHLGRAHVPIPQTIVYAEVDRYDPYYERRVYHRPHRHDHAVYTFPVYTPHGVEYRRVSYCRRPGGFVAFHGSRFGVHIGF